jgi:hypothetical protein
MESEVFIESLSWILFHFINIGNSPLLVFTIVVSENSDCIAFLILAACDIKNLIVVPVDELTVLKLEYLPPT